MDPAAILEKVLSVPRVAYVREVLDTYGRAAGGLLANGLAFSALFATIPIALVTLGVAGALVGDPKVQQQMADALVNVFPPLADLIDGALDALSNGAAAAVDPRLHRPGLDGEPVLRDARRRLLADLLGRTRSATSSGAPRAASCGSACSSPSSIVVVIVAGWSCRSMPSCRTGRRWTDSWPTS